MFKGIGKYLLKTCKTVNSIKKLSKSPFKVFHTIYQ